MSRRTAVFTVSCALLFLLAVLSVFWGRYPDLGFTRPGLLAEDAFARLVVVNGRLPRVLSAVLVGSVLAGAGTVLQTVLGNPLVEPGLLGVSQGAAFGAALAILLSGGLAWTVPLFAAIFGLAGLALSWSLARRIHYGGSILRLVLAGVVASAFFSSGLGILKYLADPRSTLPDITFWLMGGLYPVGWSGLARMAIPSLLALIALTVARWRVNLLALDDRSAFALGSAPSRERAVLVTIAVVAVAAVTAEAGIVSWVGLLVPHVSRRLAGSNAADALPVSLVLGGAFTLICDNLARSALTGEIPLGLLTALIGALAFALLMTRPQRRRLRKRGGGLP